MTDTRKLNTENWQHKINTVGEVATDFDDVGQCLETIAATQKGTVPHNPLLGFDSMKYQDMPLNIVNAKMAVELKKEFKIQEPRAEINSINFDYSNAKNGALQCIFEFLYNGVKYKRTVTLWQ